MLIRLNADGSLELIETKNTGYDNMLPMSASNFNNLLKNEKKQKSAAARRNVVANALNNTQNYFTTAQVSQLLQLVNSESFRVQLAKLSYRSVTDRGNFYQIYDLLNSQNSRNELETYVSNYNRGIDSKNEMSDARFNTLYQTIREKYPVSTQMNSLIDAFNNTSNYFSSYQASQLIQIVSGENNRLQLAKLSYRNITDRSNFNQVSNLLYNQSSRNELETYVNNYNQGIDSNNKMSDASFNNLYQTIRQQSPASTQMNSLINAFNNTNNYFSSYQASQLIQIVSGENNRLQLAKLSYRSITDRSNFNQVSNLLYNQSSRNELETYVNNYNAGVNNSNTNIAMPDADFNSLYRTIQYQFFPNQRMSTLTDVFNNKSNYFTCAQAKQLIPLVTVESNRLQLAKLSYRSIVDRGNFSQLYDLLESQASRNELDAYVKAYRD
jgi:hypothetical protein